MKEKIALFSDENAMRWVNNTRGKWCIEIKVLVLFKIGNSQRTPGEHGKATRVRLFRVTSEDSKTLTFGKQDIQNIQNKSVRTT